MPVDDRPSLSDWIKTLELGAAEFELAAKLPSSAFMSMPRRFSGEFPVSGEM